VLGEPDGSLQGSRNEDLTLVIPSHNEAAAIEQVVREWWEFRPPSVKTEILVVDDGSTDRTPQILSDLQKQIPLRVIRNSLPQGYGGSLRIGVDQARTPWVAFADGDGQYDPRDLPVLLRQLGAGFDLALGVRTRRADPFVRKVISHGFRFLLSVFFEIRAKDPTVGLRVGRTDVVRWISRQTRYMKGAFLNEFAVRLDQSRFRYAEAPIRHRPRLHGKSKNVSSRLLPKVTVQQLIALIRLWREFHRLDMGSAGPEHSPSTHQ
jgi:glycosyltransferase involved in cell wall biosynthesis